LASRQSTIWPSIQILPSRSDIEGTMGLMGVLGFVRRGQAGLPNHRF
jgi:hypothetical protein